MNLDKIWHDYGIVSIIIIIACLYLLPKLYKYFMGKSYYSETMDAKRETVYNNPHDESRIGVQGIQPTQMDMNKMNMDQYKLVHNMPNSQMDKVGSGSSCASQPPLNANELLPKDTHSEWASLNPSGDGNLKNINEFKAGWYQGIDTISSSLRNPNLQLRSDPPIPQMNTGPWNQSTIIPDTMRVPLEIGQGPQ